MRRAFSGVYAGTAVVHDGTTHRYVKDVTIRFKDGAISELHGGPPIDTEGVLDASGQLVIPGLVNIYTHAGAYAHARLRADNPEPQAFGEGFLVSRS